MTQCVPGCVRRPVNAHEGRCFVRHAAIRGPENGYARKARQDRDKRLAQPVPVSDGTRAVVANIALREAALRVAAADLTYQRALETDAPHEARRVLHEECVPARRAYRRALDVAAKEEAA